MSPEELLKRFHKKNVKRSRYSIYLAEAAYEEFVRLFKTDKSKMIEVLMEWYLEELAKQKKR